MHGLEERPPIASAALSVILPVRNLEARLPEIVRAWVLELNTQRREYELLLVDDGSADATADRAKELAAQHPRLCPLRHDRPHGLGAALRTGLAAARHPLVAYAPGDEYPPADLKALFQRIDKVDLVVGYRAARAGKRHRSWREWLHGRLVRLVFGLRLRDPGCRFVLARRDIFTRIPIQSDGPFAHVEILAKANFLACLMDEAPVSGRAVMADEPERGVRWAEVYRVFSNPDFGPVEQK